MRKSKLENYQDILSVLALNPLTLDGIAYACKMDCIVLSERMDFLRQNNLVEEITRNNRQFYGLTRRGKAVFKTFSITKRLDELKTTTTLMSDALHAISAIVEHDPEKTAPM